MRLRDAAGWLAKKVRLQRPPTAAEFYALTGILAVALALFAFAKLASEVLEGDTIGFDRAVLLALRAPEHPDVTIGPSWLEDAARDVTALGSTAVLAYVTAAAVGFLALSGRRATALLVTVAVCGGTGLSSLLKLGFDRPRPEFLPRAAETYTASFPSGHTMLSAVAYLTLGALLMRAAPRRRVKVYVLTLAVTTTLLVGASRVYLGLHWPTDVLAGWCVGAAWSLLCWLVAARVQGTGFAGPRSVSSGR